jgi:hypothetical protein
LSDHGAALCIADSPQYPRREQRNSTKILGRTLKRYAIAQAANWAAWRDSRQLLSKRKILEKLQNHEAGHPMARSAGGGAER